MAESSRKYQSGIDVLEAFIPGYTPPRTVTEEGEGQHLQARSPEELKDALLSDLRKKLDELTFPDPPR